ncbi:MAG: hypothetical protein A3G38_02355 [Omnitrophica WOR_2 bacterium RIFCSPLOWO2_12_FULL_51_8]|nr:MAG: hypothetical protein A3G38_02355 [Omnitrophica WOR_2 bacterium RIFCSPLOWO2_12_FULL_51_8]
MILAYLQVFGLAFACSALFVGRLARASLKKGLLLRQGIPLVGGIGLALAFMSAAAFKNLSFRWLTGGSAGIILPALVMLAFGTVDDWREFKVGAKIFVQVIAASLLISFGVRTHIAYIGDAANIAITFLWVLGITNAFNHLDVADGVAAVSAGVVSAALLAVCLLNNEITAAFLCLALAGALCGFLFYNLPPAKVYLGNSGSHFLGFILAAIALEISYAPLERKAALFSPILILGFPIFDSVFLVLMRLKKKRPVFQKSNDHLVLRFLKLGCSKAKALWFMFLLCGFFSLAGLLVSKAPNFLSAVIIFLVAAVSLVISFRMSRISVDA